MTGSLHISFSSYRSVLIKSQRQTCATLSIFSCALLWRPALENSIPQPVRNAVISVDTKGKVACALLFAQ